MRIQGNILEEEILGEEYGWVVLENKPDDWYEKYIIGRLIWWKDCLTIKIRRRHRKKEEWWDKVDVEDE